MTLTKRQKEVLDFLVNFVNKHGYSPSFEEIARALRLTSKLGEYTSTSQLWSAKATFAAATIRAARLR